MLYSSGELYFPLLLFYGVRSRRLSGGIHRFNLRHPHYRTSLNLRVKVLDFVKFGGPKWMVGGTIFEMWLGSL